jgi:regulator of protease activity HflC (stomatin/prohibitin superfamily)
MVVPGLDQVGAPIDLREQVALLAGQPAITADNHRVTVDTAVSFQVTNPGAAADRIGDQKLAVDRLVTNLVVGFIGGSDLDHVLASREQFSAQLRDRLDNIADEWGIRVSLVEIRSIVPAPTTSGPGTRAGG